MYAIFFYFSTSDLPKVLEFLDILNKGFEKYFGIKYDGLVWTDTEKFLKNRDGEDKKFIYSVSKINDSGPYNLLKFWDDSFYISTEVSFSDLGYDYDFSNEEISKIEEKQRNLSEEMLKKLPLLGILSCFEENEEHFSKIFSNEVLEYSVFSAKKENGKIIFFEGKSDINGIYKKTLFLK